MAGWNQTISDWQRFLDLSPRGCLLAECDGRPVATATTIHYANEIGWIGMMLVHPDFRRRGIARVMMDHCIEILRAAGVKTIKLDATPEGREVYLKIGFKEQFRIIRYQSETALPIETVSNIRRIRSEDLPAIIDLDQAAFGSRRERLIEKLAGDSSTAVVSTSGDQITGFGVQRPGALAPYIGPVVANDPLDAQQIASTLVQKNSICDLPESNEAALAWATSHGLEPKRTLTRMYLGENVPSATPHSYFAIASPDLG
jgi:ribosomal protein S18 acetylase RimI-like enzyme